MKKGIVIILLILGVSKVYTQDLINEIQKMTLAIDSLHKQVIKPLNDSIFKLNAKVKEFNKKIKTLESTEADLNKNKVKIERDSLQAQLDSLTLEIIKLTKIIITKDSQKSKYQEICELKSIQENKNGKQEVFSSIIITYKNKTLDELIENSTLSSVQRDASIIGNNTEIQQILLSMQTYYNSKRVLDEKYNKQNVENAITQLKTIEQTKQVLNLIEKLSDYELRNNALKKTIDKITDIDINFKANDDFTQKEKFKDIIVELSWYFRNYQFNMKDYPYLTEKILEIIKLKQKDANENIAYLKEKL